MPFAPRACSSSCAWTAIRVARTKSRISPSISKPGTLLVMFWIKLVKKATSKISLNAMASKLVMSPAASTLGSGPLGRVPWAWSSIAVKAALGFLIFGKPFARGKLNGVWAACGGAVPDDACHGPPW